jgi:hypothetical protein
MRACALAAAVVSLTAALPVAAPAAAAPSPLPAGWALAMRGPDGGTVWAGHLPNTYAPWDTRESEIYLPPGYSTTHRYPVLYLLHGLVGAPGEFWHSLRLADRLDALHARFIVVTPVGGQIVHPNAGEWAGIWEDYIVHDVVPWVDANLSTIPTPSGRAIEGLCAGGFGAVDIGLRHPGVFDALGSWEGYFTPFHDGPLQDATAAQLRAHDPALLVRREAPLLRREHMSFYLSAAGNHGPIWGRWTPAFAGELRSLRVNYELRMFPRQVGGRFWGLTLPSALAFAASAFSS